MRENMLALNDRKTEVMRFSSEFAKELSPPCNIRIGDACIHPSAYIRNLGVTMDAAGSMSTHVLSLGRSASFALWKVGKIRHLLDPNSTEKLIHAFVTSRLDYCNSLLFGLPVHEIQKLQLIQNSAARLITKTKKCLPYYAYFERTTWLPVQRRIEFKILCVTFKILHNMAPAYLEELLSRRGNGRSLRSNINGELSLHQPIGKTKFYGDRAFKICAPRLWNALPPTVRCLRKSHLKTHLFTMHYNDCNF